MTEKRKDRTTILAHVEAGTFPGGTLREWLEWRHAEDERMARSIAEQFKATCELIDGATVN